MPPVKALSIPTFNGTLSAAHEHARAAAEPLFVPSQVFTDDRG